MKFIFTLLILVTIQLSAGIKNLTLSQALSILDESNLEIGVARYNAMMKKLDIAAVKAKNYGTLDLSFTALRSNDPGNVFGFKVQSRDATFADFGFADFMGAIGQGAQQANGNFGMFSQGLAQNGAKILAIEPKALNYPKARNHYVTKATFKVPLFTGGMLLNYKRITEKLYELSKLDADKVRSLKRFELKKTFYNIGLVDSYIDNLNSIVNNINKLKRVIKEMQKEGYAVETDYLEADAKAAEVEAMLDQATLNRELAYQFLSFLLNKNVESVNAPLVAPIVPRISKEIIEERNLDIAKAKLGYKITKDAIAVEKSKFLPKVGAFAEYGYADNKLLPDKISNKDFYTVGVKATWNLFNGGADKASLEKAKLNRLKVAAQLQLAKKGMWLKARKLQSEISSLNSRVRSFNKQYKFAHKVFLTYKEKYREGIATITDLLIKQSKEIEMLLKLLKVKNDRNEKILALQKLING